MRIAFLTHYTGLYGANRSLLNLIDGLQSYAVAAHVIAPAQGEITQALAERNVPVSVIPLQWWVGSKQFSGTPLEKLRQSLRFRSQATKRLSANLRLLPTVVQQLKAWKVDLVYTNTCVLPTGALLAIRTGLPHVWHLREFVDIDYGFIHDWGKATFQYFVNQADARIAISQAIRTYLLGKTPSERTTVIYNGVASTAEFDSLYRTARSATQPGKPFTFALVGLIHPNKGQDTAIRAFARLVGNYRNIRLLIVGGGDSQALQTLAKDLGVQDQVEFWGHLSDPYKAYLASDAVLMCSRNEGMGRVTVEAMSACRPVIGYHNGGTSEIIQHESTGLLYRGDEKELAQAMQRLIERPEWTRQLGEEAWRVARRYYTIESYASQVYETLVSVIKSNKYSPSRE